MAHEKLNRGVLWLQRVMMRQALFLSCIAVLIVVPTGICRGDDPFNDEQLAYFETHIRPLLVSRCYSCHSERDREAEGGLTLDTRSGWSVGGDRGPTIVPGEVDASLLIQSVRYDDPDLQMPPDRALPSDAVQKLEHWVRMGAPDPRVESATSHPAKDPSLDPVLGRSHWAYQPLADVEVPDVQNRQWPLGTIDALVLSKLQQHDLKPAPDADRRTLARRVYVQLTGLPPTPAELSDFLQDDRDDALERLVDRLLASPSFGERWGRHWLDLARFADSNGLDENFLFREAWRYRNRVIELVNRDMPYDDFLREQIAGDLLAYDSIEQRDQQRISAGFLVLGPKVLLVDDRELQRMDIADEQLDTIGKAVLGQTLGCARCHDHKFDPIPTADYYALAGILTSTQVTQERYMLNQQRVMERLVGLGADGDPSNTAYEEFWRNKRQMEQAIDQVKSSIEWLSRGDFTLLAKLADDEPDLVSPVAREACAEFGDRIEAQQQLIETLKRKISNPPAIPPRAMVPQDADEVADEPIRFAGQPDRKGETVPRGFLQVLSRTDPKIPDNASGRLELADWLTDEEFGAGYLTARVMANRVWHHLIGVGLVRTVDNFGLRGETPSHPELLDHLSQSLIDSGWSIKSLVRKIVLSRTFAMSSQHTDRGHAIDPDNRLLWRAHRRRLDPETMRDGMLLAAGTLDRTPMESSVGYLGDQATSVGANKNRRRTDFPCRSVYLPVIRNDLPELFNVFDFADPQSTTGDRGNTMVPTQSLFMLNDSSVVEAAQQTAKRLLAAKPSSSVPSKRPEREPTALAAGSEFADVALPAASAVGSQTAQRLLADESVDDQARVNLLFEWICQTPATEADQEVILSYVEQNLAGADPSVRQQKRLQAWAQVCQAVFGSSRFQIVE